MITVESYFREVRHRLEQVFDQREAEAAARAILDDVAGYDTRFMVMNGTRTMVPETVARIDRVVDTVIQGEPVQYATGHARFCGLNFSVNPAVLIPRPETQGLVDLIVDRYSDRPDLHILDIGTGSGCIAIALARALKFPKIEALDISESALTVARENARRLNVTIDFIHNDILAPTYTPAEPYNIIVSNPPYIAPDEADEMESLVLDNEPPQALFTPEDDPVVFYRAIARFATKHLEPAGGLYLEINPRFADDTAEVLTRAGFKNIDILPDYLGRKRFISAEL